MPLPPPIIPAPRRIRRKRKCVASPVPVGALALVSASVIHFAGDLCEVQLVFNTSAAFPLNDAGAAVGEKWTARVNGFAFAGWTLVNSSFDTLTLTMGVIGEDPGPDEISYSNAPSDVGDTAGRMLAAFNAFPM